jgi:serine/threonine protein kinase/dienelactone hydrolase
MVGRRISHYQVLQKLGAGGMGVVYLAQDTLLGRKVALKFLAESIGQDPKAKERLVREAKSAAAIDHPYICGIYEIGEAEGKTFIAMEYVSGITLQQRLREGDMSPEQVVATALEISEALATAHESAIIHRDLKTSNVIITRDGHAKVMDFGLAKRLESESSDQESSTLAALTQPGTTPGSPAYMSPEQIRGQALDARSDLFSFGIMICEMLGRTHPFWKGNQADTTSSILNTPPKLELPSTLQPQGAFRRLLTRMLEKEPARRFQSAESIRQELRHIQSEYLATAAPQHFLRTLGRALLRPRSVIAALVVLGLVSVLSYAIYHRTAKLTWARNQAIPEIERLAQKENYQQAFLLAEAVEHYLPDDPTLLLLWPEVSRRISITSDPGGVDVFIKDYDRPSDDWVWMGQTPLTDIRVSRNLKRISLRKDGYHTLERTSPVRRGDITVTLVDTNIVSEDMVFVAGGSHGLATTGLDHLRADLQDYLIDRWEVTNQRFAEFVQAGGYNRKEFWKQEFIKEDIVLSWEDAMREFRDRTGRPGPATWELGRYPDGQEDHPVCGISWYEAAAYAEFAGKKLPTVYHWSTAASPWLNRYILALSNFGKVQTAPAGVHQGVSLLGVFDVAGNVKEWCWNPTDDTRRHRYILGGAYNEPEYMFNDPDAQSPFDRLPTYGFRCIKHISQEEASEAVSAPIEPPSRNYTEETPVSEETFRIFTRFYDYDKSELNPITETVDEQAEFWVKEEVSIDAAYGGERITVFLFLPKDTNPPYQPVIYFPHSGALRTRSNEDLQYGQIDFVVRSGRAVCYPIYQSTYERDDGLRSDRPNMSTTFREHIIQWYQDLARSIDYLETREDLDTTRLGYYGTSWGAVMGAILPALEKRINACVLVVGGFWQQRGPAETEQINFASHVTVPVLMLNGRYDWIFPVETSQTPMFRWLGTKDEHKRHLLYDTGHSIPRTARIKETLDWFDRYLGPSG